MAGCVKDSGIIRIFSWSPYMDSAIRRCYYEIEKNDTSSESDPFILRRRISHHHRKHASYRLHFCSVDPYGVLYQTPALFLFLAIAVSSILISTLIARVIGEKIFAPIKELNHATKQIADGNFRVSIKEDGTVAEVREMAHNFNRMAEELRRTEIIHNDFARNVSHEFKTPLSSIEGYATLLQSPGLSEEKRLEYASRIIAGTKRLTTMTGNILMLSRLENQQTGIERSAFSLDEQLRQIVLLYEDEWNRKELCLELDLPAVTYVGNEELLFQVWQNLFGNAVKFSNPGGSVFLQLLPEEKQITVLLRDTGIGIAEKDLNRIFEKFYQGEQSRNTPGNGLGLALAKQIAELHGGSIKASSSPQEGTEFTVILPVLTEADLLA